MTNKSDLIREFIRSLFDSNHDFSNRELNKTKFKEFFETEEKKPLDISWQKHQTLFIDQMAVVAREKNIDVKTYGYGGKKMQFKNLSQTGVKSTITPKPKGQGIQPQQTQGLQTATSTGQAATGLAQTSDKIITVLTDEESVKLTTILCKTFGNGIHRLKPDFKAFSEDEALELGSAWSPLAKPYLEKYGGRLFTAVAVSIGVMTAENRLSAFAAKPKGDKSRDEREEPPKNTNTDDFEAFQKRNTK